MAEIKDLTLAELRAAMGDDALADMLSMDSLLGALPRKMLLELLNFGELRKLYEPGALARLLDPVVLSEDLGDKDLGRFASAFATEQRNRKAAKDRDVDVSGLEGLWWDAMQRVLGALGFTLPSLERFREHRNYENFRHGLAAAEDLVTDFLSGKPGRADREREMARVRCVQCLTTTLRNQELSVNLGTVASNFERVVDAVQSSFPGYRASGLLRMTIAKQAV